MTTTVSGRHGIPLIGSDLIGDHNRRSWVLDEDWEHHMRSASPYPPEELGTAGDANRIRSGNWNPHSNLCWFPLVVVTNSKGDFPTASPSLTAMYLMDEVPRLKAEKRWDESELVEVALAKACHKTTAMDQHSFYQISTYASAFNIVQTVTDLHLQPTIHASSSFDAWKRKLAERVENIGMGSGGFELKICMVCPMMFVSDEVFYPYAPFDVGYASSWSLRIGSGVPLGIGNTFPIDTSGLEVRAWSQPNVKSHRNHVNGWTQGLLFDCGIRVGSRGSMLSRRMTTEAIQIPSLDEMFDVDCYIADENLEMDDQPPLPIFFGSPISDNPDLMSFPNVNAANQYIEICVQEDIIGEFVGGIPDSSNTADDQDDTMQSPLFIETWKDTRGILLVDLCERATCYYHEFVRCTVCNGEVEVRSPRDHIPPETECPHCQTAGAISWNHRLTGDQQTVTGDVNNG